MKCWQVTQIKWLSIYDLVLLHRNAFLTDKQKEVARKKKKIQTEKETDRQPDRDGAPDTPPGPLPPPSEPRRQTKDAGEMLPPVR